MNQNQTFVTKLGIFTLCLFLSACQSNPTRESSAIEKSLDESLKITDIPEKPPLEITDALLPPLESQLPASMPPLLEDRFDVSVKNAPAQEFFMSLVAGTSQNMVVHPGVEGEISLTLNNVTIEEVLDTVQDMYGYQYRRGRNLYQVLPARMRSKIYKVDYINVTRSGTSSTRISSGQVTQNTVNSDDSSGETAKPSKAQEGPASGSEVSTRSESNFWGDLQTAVKMIVGEEEGRSVVVNAQSGIVVVRAMPGELRDVEDFLSTIENVAHRQVLLEAKILEVTLRDSFQSGINWAAIGEVADNKNIIFSQSGNFIDPGATNSLGGVFTIDANLNDFAAMIELLQSQGDVHVLSSPRVATVNNQKAVIKVGTDEFFVTDVSTDTDSTTTGTSQTVDVTLTPFFSGVALDVIPQISEQGEVILHIHPTVSEVDEEIKEIATSTSEFLSIPLAMSTVRETDTIIRARSGQVVVIGGLMENVVRDRVDRTPGLGELPVVGGLFRQTSKLTVKSELVILLRPIVETGSTLWAGDLRSTASRFRDLHQSGSAGERDRLLQQWSRN